VVDVVRAELAGCNSLGAETECALAAVLIAMAPKSPAKKAVKKAAKKTVRGGLGQKRAVVLRCRQASSSTGTGALAGDRR